MYNNSFTINDDFYSNFSLRGKKYFERKRALEAANNRAKEINVLLNLPTPTKESIPTKEGEPVKDILIAEPIKEILIKEPTKEILIAEPKAAEPTTSKIKKYIIPSIIGGVLLVTGIIFLYKRNK